MPAPDEVAQQTQIVTTEAHNPAEQLWNLIIRPPRSVYAKTQLGPQHFRIGRLAYVRRTDVQLRNPRGQLLQCSLYEPLPRRAWEKSRAAASSRSSVAATSSPFGPHAPQEKPRTMASPCSTSPCSTVTKPSPPIGRPAPQENARPEPCSWSSVTGVSSGAGLHAPQAGPPNPLFDFDVGDELVSLPDSLPTPLLMSMPVQTSENLQQESTDASVHPGGEQRLDESADMEQEQLEPLPCVVFLHGNSSCCLEGLPLITHLAPLCISLFCFDFSGCGLSEGEYISLGWFERDDLATCIEYLRTRRVPRIALWGRSMGAVTALMHADRDPSIAGLVLDSPFADLQLLAEELGKSYAKLPSWMSKAVMAVLRSIIQGKAHFDIQDCKAIDHVRSSFSPAFFVAAHGDDFIGPHHCQRLYEAFRGEKELRLVEGTHNSTRPEALRREAILFLCRAFHCDRLDRLLQLHTRGVYDIFTAPALYPGSNDDPKGAGEDGLLICHQMQVFPALRNMRLVHRKVCHRSFAAKVAMKLQQDHSEAGVFLALEPLNCEQAPPPTCGASHFLIFAVNANALVISRVRDDSVETIAAADGLPVRQSRSLMFDIDRAGNICVQLGRGPAVTCTLGVGYKEQVTMWLMATQGQTSFGPLVVEDGEATLRGLDDILLKQRHLGPVSTRSRQPKKTHIASAGTDGTGRLPSPPVAMPRLFSEPATMPHGDMGLHSPSRTLMVATLGPHTALTHALPLPRSMLDMASPPSPLASLSPDQLQINLLEGGDDSHDGVLPEEANPVKKAECATVASQCSKEPEALVGWRVNVDSMGEGLVVGIKRRLGRSTLHMVSWNEYGEPGLESLAQRNNSFGSGASEQRHELPTAVALRRKESHNRRSKGLAFEVLCREF